MILLVVNLMFMLCSILCWFFGIGNLCLMFFSCIVLVVFMIIGVLLVCDGVMRVEVIVLLFLRGFFVMKVSVMLCYVIVFGGYVEWVVICCL